MSILDIISDFEELRVAAEAGDVAALHAAGLGRSDARRADPRFKVWDHDQERFDYYADRAELFEAHPDWDLPADVTYADIRRAWEGLGKRAQATFGFDIKQYAKMLGGNRSDPGLIGAFIDYSLGIIVDDPVSFLSGILGGYLAGPISPLGWGRWIFSGASAVAFTVDIWAGEDWDMPDWLFTMSMSATITAAVDIAQTVIQYSEYGPLTVLPEETIDAAQDILRDYMPFDSFGPGEIPLSIGNAIRKSIRSGQWAEWMELMHSGTF